MGLTRQFGVLRRALGLYNTRPLRVRESILVKVLVDCANVAAPVKVGRGIRKLGHGGGNCSLPVCIKYLGKQGKS